MRGFIVYVTPAWLLFLLVCLLARLVLGCADVEATAADVSQFPEWVEDQQQGCSWRAQDSGFDPHDADACWHIFAGQTQRVASGEISDVCEAPELSTCLSLHGTDSAVGYFDRNDRQSFEIIRYQRVETLPDGTCEPCAPK